MKKIITLIGTVVLMSIGVYIGCKREKTISPRENNSHSGNYADLVQALDSTFAWHKDLIITDLYKPMEEEVRDIQTQSTDGRFIISGITEKNIPVKIEFLKESTKDITVAREVFYYDSKQVFEIKMSLVTTTKDDGRKMEVDFMCSENSSHDVHMTVIDPNISDPFSPEKKHIVEVTLFGETVSDTLTPTTRAKDFFQKIAEIIKTNTGGKAGGILIPLNEELINNNYLVSRETEMIRGELSHAEEKKATWQGILDIFGTGVSDAFGVLITGAYGALSYWLCNP